MHAIYNFPSAIIDNDGITLTSTPWQEVCTRFHRQQEQCALECVKSDQYIIGHLLEANPAFVYCCPHGLIDCALPILIDGVQYGSFFAGQFFLEPPDLEFFRRQAQKFGFDEQIYLEAVQKVPVWSQQQLDNFIAFIQSLLEVISDSGLRALQAVEDRIKVEETERKLAVRERQALMEQFSLKQMEISQARDVLNGMLERVSDGFVAFDAGFNYTYVNEHGGALLGRTPGDLIGKNYWVEFPEADGTPFAQAYVHAMHTQQPVIMEDYYAPWDRWFSNRIYPSPEGLTIFFSDITERKRQEETLRRLNRELRAITECNQVLVRMDDEAAMLQSVCDIICKEAGYRMVWVGFAERDPAKTIRPAAWAGGQTDSLTAIHFSWAAHPGDTIPVGACVRTGQSVCLQDFSAPGQAFSWGGYEDFNNFRASLTLPLKDSSGRTLGVLNIFSDQPNTFTTEEIRLLEKLASDLAFGITTLRARNVQRFAEQALSESEERFRSFIEQSVDGVILIDEEGLLIEWNQAMKSITGLSSAETLGISAWEIQSRLLPPDRRAVYSPENFEEMLRQAIDNPQDSLVKRSNEIDIIALNGRRKSIIQTLFPIKTQRGYRIGGIVRDVSERRHAEEALQRSQEQLQAVVQTANEAIITIDENQRIAFWNDAAQQLFGYSSNEMLGAPLTQIVPERYRVLSQTISERTFAGEEMQLAQKTLETVAVDHSGREFPVEISFAAWRTGEGRFLTAIMRDISDRKERENEISAISMLSAALRKAPTLKEMLPVIVQQVVTLINCDAVSIKMIDLQNGDYVVEAGHGPWLSSVGTRQRKGTGINAIIADTLQPYVTHDFAHDPNLASSYWAESGIESCIGVPLIAQEQLIGFIWVGAASHIIPGKVRLLSAISDIAASAIHRASLHEQTRKAAASLAKAYDTTLEGWAHALELRDQETEGHTRRVVEKTIDLAKAMGIVNPQTLENIRRGALLHDIGKMGIPDSVLLKPSTLNDHEREIMRRHPEYAYTMLNQIEYLRPSLQIAYCHHEKWDGTGYPRGIKGEDIPIEARLFAIVDVWDALTSDRPYRKAWSQSDARRYIAQQSGKHFDPRVSEVFLAMMEN